MLQAKYEDIVVDGSLIVNFMPYPAEGKYTLVQSMEIVDSFEVITQGLDTLKKGKGAPNFEIENISPQVLLLKSWKSGQFFINPIVVE